MLLLLSRVKNPLESEHWGLSEHEAPRESQECSPKQRSEKTPPWAKPDGSASCQCVCGNGGAATLYFSHYPSFKPVVFIARNSEDIVFSSGTKVLYLSHFFLSYLSCSIGRGSLLQEEAGHFHLAVLGCHMQGAEPFLWSNRGKDALLKHRRRQRWEAWAETGTSGSLISQQKQHNSDQTQFYQVSFLH